MKATVLIAALMHLIWAACFLTAPQGSIHTTGTSSIIMLVKSYPTIGAIYLVAAACAGFSLFIKLRHEWRWLVLQQIMLTFSAIDALGAISRSAFADGVVRSRQFIATDQCLIVLLALLHLFYMFDFDAVKLITRNKSCC